MEQANNKTSSYSRPGGGNGNSFPRRRPQNRDKADSEFESKVLGIDRVTRVTRGGKRFSFRTTMVIGDGKGSVGVGVAQGSDVAQSMQKATNQAKKNLTKVFLVNDSIPHQIQSKYNSAVVMLKPAREGSGVKAGGPVRVVAKLAGIKNITAKLVKRTTNKINIARATILALSSLKKNK